MKHYNRDIYQKNLKDMKSLDFDVLKNTYYVWVLDIADSYKTDQVSVGCLDRNDIIQEAYLHFEIAWSNLDWDAIQRQPEENHARMIWAYLKKSIKLKLRNSITYVKDGIRTYSVDGERLGNSVDDFLSILFGEFHAQSQSVWEEPIDLYDVEKLGDGLYEAMRTFLSDHERLTMERFYGIDCERVSIKNLAIEYGVNQSTLTNQKKRSLAKLNNDEVRRIIRNNFA